METLFQNETANGEGEAHQFNLAANGGFINRTLHISGNLDGGTFTLLFWDGAAFVESIDSAITVVPDIVNFSFRSDFAKGKLSGCGASCDVTAVLK